MVFSFQAAKNVLKHKNDDRDTQGMDMDVEEENQSSNATTTQYVYFLKQFSHTS